MLELMTREEYFDILMFKNETNICYRPLHPLDSISPTHPNQTLNRESLTI